MVIGELVERRGPSGREELSEGGLGQIQTEAASSQGIQSRPILRLQVRKHLLEVLQGSVGDGPEGGIARLGKTKQ